jgi:hypothetical protein
MYIIPMPSSPFQLFLCPHSLINSFPLFLFLIRYFPHLHFKCSHKSPPYPPPHPLPYLFRMDDCFNVFLDSVSKNFIEYFCIDIHKGNWSKVLYLFWIFLWFRYQSNCGFIEILWIELLVLHLISKHPKTKAPVRQVSTYKPKKIFFLKIGKFFILFVSLLWLSSVLHPWKKQDSTQNKFLRT